MEPVITVIIAALNKPEMLDRCLQALFQSDFKDFECIIVDDASPVPLSVIAQNYPVRYFRFESRHTQFIAHNFAVRFVKTPWIMFYDSDCLMHRDTLSRINEVIQRNPEEAAFFGSYDDTPTDPSVISQYRNLLHHHVHQQNPGYVTTFWSGCGIIRTDVFRELGGYEQTPLGVRDIELGYRLTKKGYKIKIYPKIQVSHMKKWTLPLMVITDIRIRAKSWTEIRLLHSVKEKQLNVTRNNAFAACSVLATLISLFLIPWHAMWGVSAFIGFLSYLAFSRDVFYMLFRKRGLGMLVPSVVLHMLHLLCACIGLVWGVFSYKWLGYEGTNIHIASPTQFEEHDYRTVLQEPLKAPHE